VPTFIGGDGGLVERTGGEHWRQNRDYWSIMGLFTEFLTDSFSGPFERKFGDDSCEVGCDSCK
jgi:hypothetical protein